MCDAMQFMYSRYWLTDLYITPTCGYFCYIITPTTHSTGSTQQLYERGLYFDERERPMVSWVVRGGTDTYCL